MLAFNRRFDPQSIHVDEEAAKRSLYGRLCASGWFTGSLWMRFYADTVLSSSTSLGSPGGDEIAWPRPVFPGDQLTAAMEVIDARLSVSRPTLGLITLRGTMTRKTDIGEEQEVFRSRFTGMFGVRGTLSSFRGPSGDPSPL